MALAARRSLLVIAALTGPLACVGVLGPTDPGPDSGSGGGIAAGGGAGRGNTGGGSGGGSSAGGSSTGGGQAGGGANGGGGAVADAGAPVDGGQDAGSPPHGCAGATYKLCEDFEDAPDSGVPAGWARVMPYSAFPGSANPAEVFVASDQPHWGTHSLKSTSSNCAQTRLEHDIAALGATAGTHWGRAFFYVKTPAPMSSNAGTGWYHTTMIALRGDNSGGGDANECRVVDMVENAFNQSVAFLYDVPDDSCCTATAVNSYTFQYEEMWHCAEWYVDTSSNTWRYFLDGTELLSFANDTGSKLAQCGLTVSVGALCYAPPVNAPQNFTAWIDDVAIDDSRIGCQ
jgi:hypothetical protein